MRSPFPPPSSQRHPSPFLPSPRRRPRPFPVSCGSSSPTTTQWYGLGLGVLLSGRDDIEVVAEAADGRQAYDMAVQHRPDVVLLDVRMPGVDGISALPHLVQVAPVMMLTYSRESEIVHEALRLGAGGYLVHGEFTADQLVQAVRDTKDGRAHFTATAANALLAHMRQGPGPQGRPLPEGLGAALTTGVPYQGPATTATPRVRSSNTVRLHMPPSPNRLHLRRDRSDHHRVFRICNQLWHSLPWPGVRSWLSTGSSTG